jgi:hypothetical protein
MGQTCRGLDVGLLGTFAHQFGFHTNEGANATEHQGFQRRHCHGRPPANKNEQTADPPHSGSVRLKNARSYTSFLNQGDCLLIIHKQYAAQSETFTAFSRKSEPSMSFRGRTQWKGIGSREKWKKLELDKNFGVSLPLRQRPETPGKVLHGLNLLIR